MSKRRQARLELTIGGKDDASRRRGGRKPGPNLKVPHRRREEIPPNTPVEVTVKVRKGLPRLRSARFVRAFRASLAECCNRPGFRVTSYTIQNNHAPPVGGATSVIEADDKRALGNGMASLGSRIARCAHRVFGVAGEVSRVRCCTGATTCAFCTRPERRGAHRRTCC